MVKRDVLLEIQTCFENPIDDYILIDVELRGKQYYIHVKCNNPQHNSYWVSWQHYKNRGDRCGKCRYINNGKKSLIYNTNKITKIVEEHGYNLIKIDSIGDEGKITISSKEGYVIDTHVNNIARGSAPEFFDLRNPHTINNIILWCEITNKTYTLISNSYQCASKKLNWKCLKCDGEFERCWNTTQKGLFECTYCSGRKVSKHNNLLVINPEIARQWNYDKNYPVRPEDVLPNTTKKYWWNCDICGHEWEKSAHYRNQKNFSCPVCKMSKGEYKIKCYLDDNNINYLYEHSFDNCIDVKKLRFDFYLPKYKICVEYQGEFHYKTKNGFTTDNVLETQRRRDDIKRKFCAESDITLIEIPYWEFKNIKIMLNEKLSSYICNI